MKKRLLSLLLAAILLVSVLPMAFAQTTATFLVPISVRLDQTVAGVELQLRFTEGVTYKKWVKSDALKGASYIDNTSKPNEDSNSNFEETGILKIGYWTNTNKFTPTNGIMDLGYLEFEGTPAGDALEFLRVKASIVVSQTRIDSLDLLDNLIVDLSDFTGHFPDEPQAPVYTLQQSSQLGLIEPWFLKSNLYIKNGSTYLTESQLKGLKDFGVYFLHARDLGDQEPTVTNIKNNTKAVHYSKNNPNRRATVEQGSAGYMITASYTEGIYTYELNQPVYVLFYFEDETGVTYDTVKERNLLSIATKASTNANFSATERKVYTAMAEMFDTITTHRASFDNPPSLPAFKNESALFYGFDDINPKNDAAFRMSTQIVLIEPWGLQLNGYLDSGIEYTDAGVVVLHDKNGKYADKNPTLSELLFDQNTCVLSLNTGNLTATPGTAYGTKFSGIYNNKIFTYQLGKTMFTAFFYKDAAGEYHFTNVTPRNILTIATNASNNTNFSATERAVYKAMIAMNTDILAHRATFGLD